MIHQRKRLSSYSSSSSSPPAVLHQLFTHRKTILVFMVGVFVGLQVHLLTRQAGQQADCSKQLLDLLIENAAAGGEKEAIQQHHQIEQMSQIAPFTTSTISTIRKARARTTTSTTSARRTTSDVDEIQKRETSTSRTAPPPSTSLPESSHDDFYPLTHASSISTPVNNHRTTTSSTTHKSQSNRYTVKISRTNPTSTAATTQTTTVSITNIHNHKKPFSIQVYINNDIVSREIIQRKSWEDEKIHAFQNYFVQYSKEHDIPLSQLTFVDIGANVGWFTLNMAAFGVNVIAFEPMEENIQLIEQSLALEDNVRNGISDRITLFKHGLGVKDQTCFVYSHNINVGDGHVKCLDGVDNHEDGHGSSMELELQKMIPGDYSVRGRIPVRRLDNVIQTFKNEKDSDLKVVCVKMDTEGYEGNVLEGGKEFLLNSGVDVIITEFVPQWITEKGGDPVAFMSSMKDAGYRIVESESESKSESSIQLRTEAHNVQYNYKSDEGMLNMSQLPSGDLTLHSPSYIEENTVGM